MNLIRQMVTGKDNCTHDLARWSWLITTLATMGGAAWNATQTGLVDLMQFAQAIGILCSTHGAALLLKKDTEPVKSP
jgi:heme oxygenase